MYITNCHIQMIYNLEQHTSHHIFFTQAYGHPFVGVVCRGNFDFQCVELWKRRVFLQHFLQHGVVAQVVAF